MVEVRFDFFRLFLVERRQLAASGAFRPQQLVEFGVNRLRVAVLGALDEKRHAPRRQSGNAMPVQ
jgi:hypothetical protein